MKKFVFIIPVAIALTIVLFKPAKASAALSDTYGYSISYTPTDTHPYRVWLYYYKFDHWTSSQLTNSNYDNWFYNCKLMATISYDSFQECQAYVGTYLNEHPVGSVDVYTDYGEGFSAGSGVEYFYVSNMPLRWTPNNIPVYSPDDPPPIPEPGESWLSDMWNWILWQLGFNDDYSGDLVKITGGDKVHTEIVTPTPSPTPTPTPSPTPYTIQIVDPVSNQPVYTITGIPNQTIVINEGDNVENGSDFDIFEVDQIIGDGGSVSPRDGINDVMETNNDYIQDMDITSVQNSFSVLPADWLLMIGVLASLPFIAGFIAKLLK